jgi:hypothetical protein
MANLSRRLFLRSASASVAVLGTIATPAIVEAARGEASKLLEAGRALPEAIITREAALRALDEARAAYARLCPPVPDDIVAPRSISGHRRWWTEDEVDGEGQRIYPLDASGKVIGGCRRLFDSGAMDQSCMLLRVDDDADEEALAARNYWRGIRDQAAAFEAARESACRESGLLQAMEARDDAKWALARLANSVASITPLTFAGLIIKARVIEAYGRCGDEAAAHALGSARQMPADIIALFGGEA